MPNTILWRTETDWLECKYRISRTRDTLRIYAQKPVSYAVKINAPVANTVYFNNQVGDWKYLPAVPPRKLKDFVKQ